MSILLNEEVLNRQTSRFHLSLRALEDLEAIISLDVTGTIVGANADSFLLFGYVKGELVGRNVKVEDRRLSFIYRLSLYASITCPLPRKSHQAFISSWPLSPTITLFTDADA